MCVCCEYRLRRRTLAVSRTISLYKRFVSIWKSNPTLFCASLFRVASSYEVACEHNRIDSSDQMCWNCAHVLVRLCTTRSLSCTSHRAIHIDYRHFVRELCRLTVYAVRRSLSSHVLGRRKTFYASITNVSDKWRLTFDDTRHLTSMTTNRTFNAFKNLKTRVSNFRKCAETSSWNSTVKHYS